VKDFWNHRWQRRRRYNEARRQCHQREPACFVNAFGEVRIIPADAIAFVRLHAAKTEAIPDVGLHSKASANLPFATRDAAQRNLVHFTIVP
jgi:hypothetical protein